MPSNEQKLTRIGVFYDGNYFYHVSNYYNYTHPRRNRISISGLHDFIRHKVAENEGSDVKYCQIVDAHYFRGRVRALDAQQRNILLKERVFDDILVREGVTTHYLPLGPDGEKGIDVWLALEAYELAIYKHYDVSVLIACDGDFLPLVRKLNTIGTRVMLLGWDFRFTDQNGQERETRTAQVLLDEVSYPMMMHQIIDDRANRSDSLVSGLFLPSRESVDRSYMADERNVDDRTYLTDETDEDEQDYTASGDASKLRGRLQNVKDGYGFITPINGGMNIFFHYSQIQNADFNQLKPGDTVEYDQGQNERGPIALNIRVIR
jgi:cold shock CspA family protein